MTDPYSTLGISKTASEDEIKKAFRKLAHQYHPDKKGGSAVKFKEINEAYQVLSDPAKRRQYDQTGFAGNGNYSGGQSQGSPFGGGYSSGGFSGGGGFEDIFDLFGSAFGGGFAEQGGREPTKGEDIYVEVPVAKKDLGTTKVFEFEAHQVCTECKATGVAKGFGMKNCETCKGEGRVRQSVRTPFGTFAQVGICPTCMGRRKIPEKKCAVCSGSGRVEGTQKIEIHIPDKLEDSYRIAFPKAGNAGKEGKPPGDLLITLKLKKGLFG